MILKRLRENKKWSQEQLAIMAGLSVRTIQRIERGQPASVESLKSLASVLEVNISTLEQEIFMIDKKSKKWEALPLLFRLNFVGSEVPWLGLSQRKHWIRGEQFAAIAGIVIFAMGFLHKDFYGAGTFLVITAYAISLVTRMGDKYTIW
jgi:transcriptional regulator with XRE-family HTH domain